MPHNEGVTVLVAQANNNNRKKRQEKKKPKPNILEAKTENQKNYIRSIVENDVVFCTGPSGSGKSFIAAGIASQKILKDEIDTIIVSVTVVVTVSDIMVEVYRWICIYMKLYSICMPM